MKRQFALIFSLVSVLSLSAQNSPKSAPAIVGQRKSVGANKEAVEARARKKTGNSLVTNFTEDLRALVETPAVPGYEQQVAAEIVERVKSISPQFKVAADEQSNV